MIDIKPLLTLQILNIILFFLAGFFFGRAYQLRQEVKHLEKLLKDFTEVKKPLKGGDKHGSMEL